MKLGKKRIGAIGQSMSVLALAVADFLSAEVSSAATEPGFEIYGFTQVDYIQDFRRVNPAWDDTLRPSKIALSESEFGNDGQAMMSVRQSRFGAKSTLPIDGNDLSTQFEFDLFGVGVDEGQTTIRLRHAYGQWRQWLAGQTHSLFMDIDIFPNVIDYWGPAGMVFLRNPQIRWTPISGSFNLAFAIERPSNDIDPGQIREIAPELGVNIRNDEKLPDLTGQARLNGDWGHVQLGGILRRVGYETVGAPDNRPLGFKIGWGFDGTAAVNFLKKDQLLLGVVYGRGIASYMNDGGTDIAPDGTPGAVNASTVPLLGVSGYVNHYWTDQLSTSLGYSRTQVDNRELQSGDAFHRGEYASVNLLYTPAKNVMMGGELLWGRRVNNDDNQGNDIRTQISFKYNFSSKDFPIKL